MKGVRGPAGVLLLATFLALAGADPARAIVIVDVVPSASAVAPGDEIMVEIRASLSDPVLGFGFDLGWDVGLLEALGTPEIGPSWIAVAALDGDGLAGLAPAPIAGDDILLATLHFRALAPGITELVANATPGDLAEGFALDPLGFESHVEWGAANVSVVPEPGATCAVMVAAAVWLASRRLLREVQ